MKKVLSVAMASAMVLGMGANAFAIQYSTGSNEEAAWPSDFKFAGSLFVTDKDGNIVESTLTDLNGKTRVDFQPGDTIWMPLYADNQRVYEVTGSGESAPAVDARTEYVAAADGYFTVNDDASVEPFTYEDKTNKVVYYYGATTAEANTQKAEAEKLAKANGEGWRVAQVKTVSVVVRDGSSYKTISSLSGHTTTEDKKVSLGVTDDKFTMSGLTAAATNNWPTANTDSVTRTVTLTNSAKTVNITATSVAGESKWKATLTASDLDTLGLIKETTPNDTYTAVSSVEIEGTYTVNATTTTVSTGEVKVADHEAFNTQSVTTVNSDVYVKVNLPALSAVSTDLGTTVGANEDNSDASAVYKDDYHYTGNIDKNWSINLIEEDNGVADLIDHAELYKADEVDYLSYKDYTTEIMPNAVYLKVELKDTWKLAKAADLKYYVYVADNKSGKETNKVWVSGKYEASNVKTVDFTWTNDASQPAVWKVAKNENGIAVFDFADKAFFQVKMYAGESMYLDLSTAYDAAMAGDFDEADQFFAFDNENANFSRTGTLILVSDDASLIPYQVTEDGYTKVDAEYVEDFVIAHTNEKVDGFVFETKELGNYVLATDELVEEEDNKDDNTQEVVVPDDDNKETENNSKPNPITGAEDFVGLAVSLAVVSVAAAGALALKK